MRLKTVFCGLLSGYVVEIVVLGGAFFLLLPGLFWGMPSEFPSEIDTILPMGPIHFFLNYTGSHDQIIYPAFHYLICGGMYAVCFVLFKLSGILGVPVAAYPFGFHDPVTAMTILIVAGRAVTAIMGAAICAVLFRTIRMMTDRTTALFMTLSLMTSAVFAYYSRVTDLDIPECFWWVLSYAIFLQSVYGIPVASRRAMLLSGIFGGFAIATKDEAMMFIIPQCLLLLYDGKMGRFAARLRKTMAYTAIVCSAYVLAAILPQPVRWANHFRFIVTLSNQSPFRTFGYTLHNQVVLLFTTVRYFFISASPLVALLGLAGTAFLLVKKRSAIAVPIIVPVLFFYCVMIVPIGFVYERYTLNAAIIALIPAGYAFYGIRRRCAGKKHGLVFLLAAGMVVAAECCSGYVPLTIAMTVDAKRKLTEVLTRIVPAGSRILTHASYFSMANADAYRTFTFCSQDHWACNVSNRMATLIDHDTAGTQFVLADHDLLHRSSWKKGENIDTASLALLATAGFPSWIERGSLVYRGSHAAGVFFVAQTYYLYNKLK
jgi:hypothetical protein